MIPEPPAPRRRWKLVGLLLAVLVAGAAAIGALLSVEDQPSVAAPTTEPAQSPSTTVPLATPTTTVPPATTTTIGFEPITINGSGSEIVSFRAPDDLATVLRVTHDGRGAFSVTTLDADAETIEVLVDTEGPYQGSRAVNLLVGDVISAISVLAEGDWSITAIYLGALERSVGEAMGSGDDVVLMDITSPAMAIRHEGEGEFSIYMWTFDDQGYVVQESGNVDMTASVPVGSAVIEVEADGEWRLSASG